MVTEVSANALLSCAAEEDTLTAFRIFLELLDLHVPMNVRGYNHMILDLMADGYVKNAMAAFERLKVCVPLLCVSAPLSRRWACRRASCGLPLVSAEQHGTGHSPVWKVAAAGSGELL